MFDVLHIFCIAHLCPDFKNCLFIIRHILHLAVNVNVLFNVFLRISKCPDILLDVTPCESSCGL